MTSCELRNYYLDQNFVRVNGKLGAPFQSGRGVRQGCLLSPLLFDIVLDWVFRRAKDQLTPICHGTISLWGLAYADDIALVAYTPDVLQRNLNVLQEHLQKVGLKISPAKTKAMSLVTRCRVLPLAIKSMRLGWLALVTQSEALTVLRMVRNTSCGLLIAQL